MLCSGRLSVRGREAHVDYRAQYTSQKSRCSSHQSDGASEKKRSFFKSGTIQESVRGSGCSCGSLLSVESGCDGPSPSLEAALVSRLRQQYEALLQQYEKLQAASTKVSKNRETDDYTDAARIQHLESENQDLLLLIKSWQVRGLA